MFQIASLKIICTDPTEILFSKLRAAGLNYHLPEPNFLLTLTVRGFLIGIAIVVVFSINLLNWLHITIDKYHR